MEETPAHDPVDWAERYREEHTPWDLGHAHGELRARLARGELAPPRDGARAYVPGCGRGHDALALARAGWRVTAVDLVDSLAGPLQAELEPLGGDFHAGDALAMGGGGSDLGGAFDLVWEHTFLCALAPELRPAWSAMVRRCLRPGGHFAALIFPLDKPLELGGPPWGYDLERLREWLGEGYELVEDAGVDPALEERAWGQAFALLRRAPGA